MSQNNFLFYDQNPYPVPDFAWYVILKTIKTNPTFEICEIVYQYLEFMHGRIVQISQEVDEDDTPKNRMLFQEMLYCIYNMRIQREAKDSYEMIHNKMSSQINFCKYFFQEAYEYLIKNYNPSFFDLKIDFMETIEVLMKKEDNKFIIDRKNGLERKENDSGEKKLNFNSIEMIHVDQKTWFQSIGNFLSWFNPFGEAKPKIFKEYHKQLDERKGSNDQHKVSENDEEFEIIDERNFRELYFQLVGEIEKNWREVG